MSKRTVLIIAGILVLFGLAAFALNRINQSSDENDTSTTINTEYQPETTEEVTTTVAEPKSNPAIQMGEESTVDGIAYKLTSAEWREQIEDYKSSDPSAAFLVVYIQGKNVSNSMAKLPNIILKDENGSTYEQAEYASSMASSINEYEVNFRQYLEINPNILRKGMLIYEAPKDKHYQVQISCYKTKTPTCPSEYGYIKFDLEP